MPFGYPILYCVLYICKLCFLYICIISIYSVGSSNGIPQYHTYICMEEKLDEVNWDSISSETIQNLIHAGKMPDKQQSVKVHDTRRSHDRYVMVWFKQALYESLSDITDD